MNNPARKTAREGVAHSGASHAKGQSLGLPPVPKGPAGVAALLTGDSVRYLALAGGLFDALVTAVRPDQTLDLSVLCPGCAMPVPVTRVVCHPDGADCVRGTCFRGGRDGS